MTTEQELVAWVHQEQTPNSLMILADYFDMDGQVYAAEEMRVASKLLSLFIRLKARLKPPMDFIEGWVNCPSGSFCGVLAYTELRVEVWDRTSKEATSFWIIPIRDSRAWDPFYAVCAWHASRVPQEYIPII